MKTKQTLRASMARGPRTSARRRRRRTTVAAAGDRTSPHAQYRGFCATLRAAIERYAAERPDGFGRLLYSSSMDTDGHVVALLRHAGLHTPVFEGNVLNAVRHVWSRAFAAMPTFRDARWDALRDPAVLLDALRADRPDVNRGAVMDAVVGMKDAYVEHVRRGSETWATAGLRDVCVVLTCWAPKERGCTLNSLGYCRAHWGLALVNGLRHAPGGFCDACHVWNLLGLKRTGGDPGHRHNTLLTLRVPLHDQRTGRMNAGVRRFCAAGFRPPAGADPKRVTARQRVTYVDAQGRSRLVPVHAWAYVGRNGLAGAWALVEREDLRTGDVVPVARLTDLRDMEARLAREARVDLFPCTAAETPNPWGVAPVWGD